MKERLIHKELPEVVEDKECTFNNRSSTLTHSYMLILENIITLLIYRNSKKVVDYSTILVLIASITCGVHGILRAAAVTTADKHGTG